MRTIIDTGTTAGREVITHMRSLKTLLLVGFILTAMVGIVPGQVAQAVEFNVDLTPDRDRDAGVSIVPDGSDRDQRHHEDLDERHERFHESQEHERFHRDLERRDRDLHDRF